MKAIDAHLLVNKVAKKIGRRLTKPECGTLLMDFYQSPLSYEEWEEKIRFYKPKQDIHYYTSQIRSFTNYHTEDKGEERWANQKAEEIKGPIKEFITSLSSRLGKSSGV